MNGTPWLAAVVVTPLLGAALTPIVGRRNVRLGGLWALAVAVLTSVAAAVLVVGVARHGPFSYYMGGWAPPWGIELFMDEFGASIAVICVLEVLTIVFAIKYVEKRLPRVRIPYFYTLMLLNMGGMIGFAVTGDIFNMFVFLEILSLSGYALVAIAGERLSEMAAFKYLMLGAISSLFILFAIGLLYAVTGTLNMLDMASRLRHVTTLLPVSVALAGLILGFGVKAALFPLHVWLPDAHAIAPSPVSAILSGLVVKIGALGTLRVLQIYYAAQPRELPVLNGTLAWLGAVSIVTGAFFAIFQEDIKMMLAYSTISNIGYIFLGIGLGSTYGLIGATVHIFNHALIKVTLFLAAGAIIYCTGYRKLSDLSGVGRAMPWTAAVMTVGAVSIVGIPPTAGFLCKWYIALGAIQAGKPLFAVALLFGALFILIYYIRMLNAFYFHEPVHAEVAQAREAPLSMLIPLVMLAAGCLLMGVLGRIPLSFIEPAVIRMLGH